MRVALIGAGARGFLYTQYLHNVLGIEIAAVADPDKQSLALARDCFKVPKSMCYMDGLDLIDSPVEIDALIIASQDKAHYSQTMAALDKGWDIILEKPISPNLKECFDICEKAEAKDCNVTVCHVLRYTPFFNKLKEIIDSRIVGRIVTINHTEHIGNFHMAHSFVRGNWRNSADSSPIIMAKSCHDMDILFWLIGSSASKISSFGRLSYFHAENAPEGSADRCLDCSVAEGCRFDVRKAYLPIIGNWPATILTPDQSEGGIIQALRESQYGRCVFKCDNDVCDHQSTAIEFENGVTATFSLSAMTNRICRTIHIMCEDGEIYGDDEAGKITVTRFRSNGLDAYEQQTIHIGKVSGGHGGGDESMMDDFVNNFHKKGVKESRTSISKSVESHLMAYAAEESRLIGSTVNLTEYKNALLNPVNKAQ